MAVERISENINAIKNIFAQYKPEKKNDLVKKVIDTLDKVLLDRGGNISKAEDKLFDNINSFFKFQQMAFQTYDKKAQKVYNII